MDEREQFQVVERVCGRDPELPRLLGGCLCLDFANTF
jgi:hypothetical protein